jgi:ATP-dependent Clp protease ATP-binding subunit ClpA
MIENLTPEASQVLAHAREEAQRLFSGRVEPIHLLLALARTPLGGAARIFTKLNVSPGALLRSLEELAASDGSVEGTEKLGLGPGVLRLVGFAGDEAIQGGHDRVDTDHLLLGIARLDKEPTSGVLARAGLTLDAMRPVVRSKGTLARGALDARANSARSTSRISLRDLENRGFRGVKVLRAGDVNQLIVKAVETALAKTSSSLSPEERERVLAQAKAEYESQTKRLQEAQAAEERLEARARDIEEAHRNLVCPLGHAPMDRVTRGDVQLAVCPECIGTFFAPGQLEALFRALSASTDSLRRFLEPEIEGPG